MKDSLQPGLELTREWDVTADKCISFMGDDLRVYATPSVVADMEYTCRDMVLGHLDDDEDSVGTRVEIDHTGATLVGQKSKITVTITEVKGRLVSWAYSVNDGVEDVAKGVHTRFVVDVAKTAERLAAKKEKAGV